jgi:hypothetical protein
MGEIRVAKKRSFAAIRVVSKLVPERGSHAKIALTLSSR